MSGVESAKRIEELQYLEHQLQHFLAQKQSVQIELNELENALAELKGTTGDVYKISSGFMITTTKEKLTRELEEKKKIISTRISAMEKQEKILEKDASALRSEVTKMIRTT